jgi:uncharacterized protein YkwD
VGAQPGTHRPFTGLAGNLPPFLTCMVDNARPGLVVIQGLPARPPSPLGRWRRTALALGVALALVATPYSGTAAASTTLETRLHALINQTRSAHGVDALTLEEQITRMAHRHSVNMSRENALFHSPCLTCRLPLGGGMLAENVGFGRSIRGIHRMMMSSSGHRNNILKAGFERVGVGVVKKGNRIWVTEIFVG